MADVTVAHFSISAIRCVRKKGKFRNGFAFAGANAYRVDRASAPQVIRLCSEMIAEDPKAPLPYLVMAEVYLADGEIVAAAE